MQFWSNGLLPQGDQLFYLRQAQYLGQGYGFVYRNPWQLLGQSPGYGELIPTAAHPPLYTAWLGLVGLVQSTGDGQLAFRLATALLGAATVTVVGLAGRRLAGDRAGLLAAGLAAAYPNLWINDVLLYSEAMYALTIALVLLASAAFAADRSTRNAAFLGATVALAALARAEALVLIVLLVVPLVVWAPGPWRDRLRRLGVAVVVAGVVVGPWIVRNNLTFSRRPVAVSNGAGYVVEISNCDASYGLGPGGDDQLGYWSAECDRTPWAEGDESETAAVKLRTGLDYVADHDDRFPVVLAARVGRIWDVWRPGQGRDFNAFFEGRGTGPSTAALIFYYPLLVAAGAGLVVLRRRRQPLSPYVAIAVMSTLTAAVSFGITRYRVGADVALVVLAGVALDALLRRREAARTAAGADADPASTDVPVASGAPT